MKYLLPSKLKTLSPVKQQVYDRRLELEFKRYILAYVYCTYWEENPRLTAEDKKFLAELPLGNPRLYADAVKWAETRIWNEYAKLIFK